MKKFKLKTPEEVQVMAEGGRKLARVKRGLRDAVVPDVSAFEVEVLAQELIEKEGAEASFAKVPGYRWATCINVNEGVVHGIPKKEIIFSKGDIVSVDVGLFYKGFHTDTSFSVYLGKDPKISKFLEVGKNSLNMAIKQAKVGNILRDVSGVIELVLADGGYSPIEALVGHGIGRDLHEDPMIPGYTGYQGESFPLREGVVLAIEVMYTMGTGEVKTDADGWTISTKDGTLSALFEETVAVAKDGPFVLTA